MHLMRISDIGAFFCTLSLLFSLFPFFSLMFFSLARSSRCIYSLYLSLLGIAFFSHRCYGAGRHIFKWFERRACKLIIKMPFWWLIIRTFLLGQAMRHTSYSFSHSNRHSWLISFSISPASIRYILRASIFSLTLYTYQSGFVYHWHCAIVALFWFHFFLNSL